ncbi:MAG: CoA-binding protein [Campylobacterales bacterium]
MACEFPVVNETDETIKEIFKTVKTIAVIGLSPDADKDSHKVAKYLQEAGYRVVPVYPKEETILGEKVYRSLSEIPFVVDMADMFRKPEVADTLADEAIARGDVKVLWLQKGIVNNAALQKAQAAGLRAVQNKCAMVEHRMYA